MLRRIAAVFTVVFLLSFSAATISAQDGRTVFWQRWDVEITNVLTSRNQFDVTEIYDVQFGGTFRFGSAVIPTDRLDSITNVRVSEGGRQMRETCSGQLGTFCLDEDSDGLSITYYF